MAYNEYGNRFQRTTPVVLNLIILNALVYLIQRMFDTETFKVTNLLALLPLNAGFKPYQLVTHMFAHSPFTIAHILFNMFALWSFGSWLERAWGPKRFLIFYLACGLAAGVAQLFLSNGAAVGASGAIMGLFAAFAYLFPNAELLMFPIPFPVKAKWAVAVMAAIDLFGGVQPAESNIAHFAHLGGLVMGFILVIYWNKTNKKTFY
ncbi:MAG: rhomboid family intramembrane serine protease [Ferruginibacter sp.]